MKELIDFIKLPINILSALMIASGILLFAPENIIFNLYMTEFKVKYGFALGMVFIVSSSIVMVDVLKRPYRALVRWYELKKLKEEQRNVLLKFDGAKIELINKFIQQSTHTLMLPMQDGLVIELQHYGVISPAGQTHMVSMLNPAIKFFLQPWVLERIKENKKLQMKYYH